MKFLHRIQMERDRLGVSFLQSQEITGIPVQLRVEKLSIQVILKWYLLWQKKKKNPKTQSKGNFSDFFTS